MLMDAVHTEFVVVLSHFENQVHQDHVCFIRIRNKNTHAVDYESNCALAPVPLTIFRSNSKFDQNLQCSRLTRTQPTVTLPWRVQDFVAIDGEYSKLEHSKISDSIELPLVGRAPGKTDMLYLYQDRLVRNFASGHMPRASKITAEV